MALTRKTHDEIVATRDQLAYDAATKVSYEIDVLLTNEIKKGLPGETTYQVTYRWSNLSLIVKNELENQYTDWNLHFTLSQYDDDSEVIVFNLI